MFFSIIVPIYNVEKYVEECIKSIITQTCRDFELILVDDGSMDLSGKICDQYADQYENIQVIHKKNGGLSDARNAGIDVAKGKYILFVDGDDYIESECLDYIKECCVEQEMPELCFLDARKVFPSGKYEALDEALDENRIINKSQKDVLEYISHLKKYPGSACTKLLSRKLFARGMNRFVKGVKSEDLDWTKKILFCVEKFGYCHIPYYCYRQEREGSIGNTVKYENFLTITNVVNTWIDDAEGSEEWKKNILLSFSAYEYKVLLVVYSKIEEQYKKEAFEWLKQKQWLLSYRSDKDIKLIRSVSKFIGLKYTILLIQKYKKI